MCPCEIGDMARRVHDTVLAQQPSIGTCSLDESDTGVDTRKQRGLRQRLRAPSLALGHHRTQHFRVRSVARAWIDQVMHITVAMTPTTHQGRRLRERFVNERKAKAASFVARILDSDVPSVVAIRSGPADANIATHADARAERTTGQQTLDDTVRDQSFADAAQVDATPGGDLHRTRRRVELDDGESGHRRGPRYLAARDARIKRKAAVVAKRDQASEHRWVEPTLGVTVGEASAFERVPQQRRHHDRSSTRVRVQCAQLTAGSKARPARLTAFDLGQRPISHGLGILRPHEELDLRAHRGDPPLRPRRSRCYRVASPTASAQCDRVASARQHGLLVLQAGTVVGGVVGFGAGAAVVGGAVDAGAGDTVVAGAGGAVVAGAAPGAGAVVTEGAAAVVTDVAGVATAADGAEPTALRAATTASGGATHPTGAEVEVGGATGWPA